MGNFISGNLLRNFEQHPKTFNYEALPSKFLSNIIFERLESIVGDIDIDLARFVCFQDEINRESKTNQLNGEDREWLNRLRSRLEHYLGEIDEILM